MKLAGKPCWAKARRRLGLTKTRRHRQKIPQTRFLTVYLGIERQQGTGLPRKMRAAPRLQVGRGTRSGNAVDVQPKYPTLGCDLHPGAPLDLGLSTGVGKLTGPPPPQKMFGP